MTISLGSDALIGYVFSGTGGGRIGHELLANYTGANYGFRFN